MWSLPETTSAAEDCNEEVPERMGKAEAGAKAAKGAIAGKPQACCPSYCGECPDNDTCKRVRGQNAEGALCPIKVLSLECSSPEKTPMYVYLKKRSEAVPPCFMEAGV